MLLLMSVSSGDPAGIPVINELSWSESRRLVQRRLQCEHSWQASVPLFIAHNMKHEEHVLKWK